MAENIFNKLTRLFSSGPSVKRKVKNYDSVKSSAKSPAIDIFQRARNDVYNSVLSSYGSFDRMARYSDFAEMESTPEIASALDIYSEETVSQDEHGTSLHVYSENRKIQQLLETLFYDTLNTSFNLRMWTRNLCKYGDFFLFLDVDEKYGVVNTYPIPISEIEREEGFDPESISAYRFRWVTQGNTLLKSWQVAHFRLLGNDAFLPYGTSVLDSARRIWRQLILLEDAMLVYRVIRAPERRVFYIDIGNIPPEEVANYMEAAKSSLKRQPIVDQTNGRVDLRFNPYDVNEDYFLPVRGGETGTRIDTLAGGVNAAAIEDVEYIQKKLFAALKIPRAYLGYDEAIGSKATLAQEDIRFSRTIQDIQKVIISELNKIAMVHLAMHGFDGEDLIDFELNLSNPSSIAQQQKLDLISTRFEIAGRAPEGVVDRHWIRKHVMNLTDFDIAKIEQGRIEDKVEDLEIESVSLDDESGDGDFGGGFGGGGLDDFGGGDEDLGGDDLFAADQPSTNSLLTSLQEDDDDDDEEEEDYNSSPIKADSKAKNVFGGKLNTNKSSGPVHTKSSPNIRSMVSVGSKARSQDTSNQPYDREFLRSPFGESSNAYQARSSPKITRSIQDLISNHRGSIKVLNESEVDEFEINIDLDED